MKRFERAILLVWILAVNPAWAAEHTPSDDIDIRALIELSAARLHKRFIVDPRVNGNVMLVGLDPNTLTYAELQSILSVHGFVTTPERNGTIEILPDTNARQMPTPVVTDRARKDGAEEVVTKTLAVGSLNAVQLATTLRPLLPPDAHLVAHPETNSLLVVARQANVARLEAIIRELQN